MHSYHGPSKLLISLYPYTVAFCGLIKVLKQYRLDCGKLFTQQLTRLHSMPNTSKPNLPMTQTISRRHPQARCIADLAYLILE